MAIEDRRGSQIMKQLGVAYQEASSVMRQSLLNFQNSREGMGGADVPIVSTQGYALIDWMLRRTREGFQLGATTSDNPSKQLQVLSAYPISGDALIEATHALEGQEIEEATIGWFAIAQFKATLLSLLQRGDICYADLPTNTKPTLGLSEVATQKTLWHSPANAEHTWSLIFSVGRAIKRALLNSEDDPHRALKAGHFLDQGFDINPFAKKKS